MIALWYGIALTVVTAFVIKAAGPLLAGDRALPGPARHALTLLAPVVLMSLVVSLLLGPDAAAPDVPRLGGVTAAAAMWLYRRSLLPSVLVGVVCTATLRALLP